MTLEELKQIKESLQECNPSVEDFSWGPTLEFAQQRKQSALKIINREIKRLKDSNGKKED
jgi:hypothetical protein